MKKGLLILLVAVFFFPTSGSVNAALITFDSPPIVGTDTVYLNSYSEDGFTITGNWTSTYNYFRSIGSVWDPGNMAGSWAGSRGIVNWKASGVSMLNKTGGGSFSLASVDLSEVTKFYLGTGLSTMVFTGYLTGGGTATYSATLDGVFGYETFSFGSLFSDVTSVSWVSLFPVVSPNNWYNKAQVDNLNVGAAPVPEPTTMLLLGLGLMGLAGVRRKFKK